MLSLPHRVGVSPSRWKPWRERHIRVARGRRPQPPLSLAAVAAPDSASPASSLSRADPSCYPQEREPSRDSLEEGPLPLELAASSQPDQWKSDRAVRGSEVTLPGAGPLSQAEEELQGSCTQPWAPWSPGKMNIGSLSAALTFSSCPPRKTGIWRD